MRKSPGGLSSVLIILIVMSGCGADDTAAEASEALARLFNERLEALSNDPEPVAPDGWSEWEADLFAVGFEGIGAELELDPDLELDPELRAVMEAYWEGNEVVEVSADASLAEQGLQLADSHARTAEKFEAYATALSARIDADREDTAARGLLSVAINLHMSATQSLYFLYPRYELLDRVVLDGDLGLEPPPCDLFDSTPQSQDLISACGLPSRARQDAEQAVNDEVVQLLVGIMKEQPDSAWPETAFRAVHFTDIRVKPSSSIRLPVSSARAEIHIAPNLVISPTSIGLDGVKVIELEDSLPLDQQEFDLRRGALEAQFRKVASDAKRPNAVGPPHLGRWLVQCDGDVRWGLIRDVCNVAAEAGYTRPMFVVSPESANPLLQHTRLFTLRTELLESAGAPGMPSLVVRETGFELFSPRHIEIPTPSGGGRPYAELQRQMREIHGKASFDTAIAVSADPTVRFDTLVATLDAIREDACDDDGNCLSLYPEVWLVTGELP